MTETAYRRHSLRIPAIFAEKIKLAPKACDIEDPHGSPGCDHATWSITWGYGGVFVQELKLCEKHKDDLLAQLQKEHAAELAELRDLADLVNDADILTLPPELLAVRQRWIAERHEKERAELIARGELR